MSIVIPDNKLLRAYAVIVDINNFATMVRDTVEGWSGGLLIAQFTRDTLSGAIAAIESNEGQVVGIMGDAIFGVVPEGSHIFAACVAIAKTVDRACEYLSDHQREFPQDWHYAPGGPSLKIYIEFGWMDVSTITTRHLGTQKLLIGPPINYASRIGRAGTGNRCLLGPVAAQMTDLAQYSPRGPFRIGGKDPEQDYIYYEVSLGDIWREGERGPDEETYWG
jgi:class 3 adenylate cyclase